MLPQKLLKTYMKHADFDLNYSGIVDNRVRRLLESNILAGTEESFLIPAVLKCVAYMNEPLTESNCSGLKRFYQVECTVL